MDGVVKYKCDFIRGECVAPERIASLMKWRNRLHDLSLIGVYDNGIGYGNISLRIENSLQFVISGSQTGHLSKLDASHYTKVTDFDIERNSLTCCGPILASSESLTHAAIYSCEPTVNAIIHVHNAPLWRTLMNQVPTTRSDIEYGTADMAHEMQRLVSVEQNPRIIVMAGHENGVITFGRDLDEAGAMLLSHSALFQC